MKTDVTKIISNLDYKEINLLLKLYYFQKGVIKNSNDFDKIIVKKLTDKNLIAVSIKSNENIISLTDYGLSVCGTVMFDRVSNNSKQFHKEIERLPERAVACFIKRILWKDSGLNEEGIISLIKEGFNIADNIWYERVLLKDARICNSLEEFYNILEKLSLIENNDGQRWCLPEVENYLKDEYGKLMDLTWIEEDSLKYYFFFLVYAQEQKNLINFSGLDEEYRSILYDDFDLSNYMSVPNITDSKMLLSTLGISKKRIISFLEDMQLREIVGERYYPLINSSFFANEDNIFVINDIKGYIEYIKNQFLTPVVDSLLSK
jgi:hypothetical protein